MLQRTMKRGVGKYKDLTVNQAQIVIVDAAGHAVLSAFCPSAQTYAAKALKERGVQIRLGTTVKEVGGGHVVLSDGATIPTHTVIWAGGLKAAPLASNVGIQDWAWRPHCNDRT